MLDLIAFTKTQLADIVRNLQELRGESISASSSLLRVKSEVLAEWIGRLAEDRWVIAADGTVQPAVVAPEPAEPQETPPEPPAPEPDAKPDYRPEPAAEVQDLPSASEPAAEPPAAPEPAPTPAASAEEPAGRVLPPLPPGNAIIVLLRADNPKQPGSASAARYALLRSGMTVADYLAAAGSRGRRTLRKAMMQGHVRVEPAG